MSLPLATTDTGPVISPVSILKSRSNKQGSSIIPQVHVQWENSVAAEARWENLADMKEN
jgi:hypothetical protein